MLGAGLYLAHRDSLTTDEGIHVASGYLILTRGDWRFDPEHPPLMKLLTALPLLTLHLHLPPDDQKLWAAAEPTLFDSWSSSREWTDQWFYRSSNNADLMVFLMRIPAVLLLVLLGFLTFVAAKRWFSENVGLWALLLVAFNPTLLGHGHLANDDVAVAAALLGSLIALINWYKAPSTLSAFWVGLLVAATVCVKFSGVIVLVPLFAVLYSAIRGKKPHLWQSSAVVAGTVYVGIWALYGFRSSVSLSEPSVAAIFLHNQGLRISVAAINRALAYLRHFLPIPFLKGLLLVRTSTFFGRGAYIFGHHYDRSVWFYFPALFLIKTQLIALLCGLWAFMTLTWRKLLLSPIENWLLAVAIGTITLSALVSRLDLGIRHIATILPLLSIALACVLARWKLIGTLLFIPLYVVPALIQLPNSLGFTNELVQPYTQAWRFMDGSNLDWGIQAKEAASELNRLYPGTTVATDYYWNPYALGYYGMRTKPFDPEILPVGTPILVSASNMNDPHLAGLQQHKPVSIISNSTFVYYIQP